MRAFKQVDVFTAVPYRGNPVAVVMDGSELSDEQMQRFAHWTNLSETTFLLPPTDSAADYRLRIFTPGSELPFAGHPTIGSCHAWVQAGGVPRTEGTIVQECAVGLVPLRMFNGRLAFAAPPLLRSGSVDESDLELVARVLQINRSEILDAAWADNGPGWVAVRLSSAEAVRALQPDFGVVESSGNGVVGPSPLGAVGLTTIGVPGPESSDETAIEVRAFFRAGDVIAEDPVTGSLNAAVAQWLLSSGDLTAPYVAGQGSALGRDGRVYIDEADGEVWVGGDAVTCIDGSVALG